MTRRVIVTGGSGFIGSNLVVHLLDAHPDWEIVNLDALTYAASPRMLAESERNPRYRFHRVDLADRAALHAVIMEERPDGVFHLAAETHVDNSIRDPEVFIRSNVTGTFNLLEELRALWENDSGTRLLHVSTDEVFGSLPAEGIFTERSSYAPRNPYSASKAASDHLVRAWHNTWGFNAVITNSSNNYGPGQHREKLIPTVIAAALDGRPIPVYGEGANMREWLYVRDHCAALDTAFERGRSGEQYLIGGRNERRNIDLVRTICAILDEEIGGGPAGGYASLISFVEDRPGHDLRYAVDPSKIERETGWRATTLFDEGLRRTVRWYCDEHPVTSRTGGAE